MKIVAQPTLRRICGTADPEQQLRVMRGLGITPAITVSGQLIVFEEALLAAQTRYLHEQDAAEAAPDWSAL